MNFKSKYFTKVGWLEIDGNEEYITSITFSSVEPEVSHNLPLLFQKLHEQLDDFFIHKIWNFDVPIRPKGTDFQRRVWSELQKINFGEIISYQKLAHRIDNEKAVRAVASANGRNPISILIPCHRVIGKDGSLTGYSGGLNRKKFLLELEGGYNSLELF